MNKKSEVRMKRIIKYTGLCIAVILMGALFLSPQNDSINTDSNETIKPTYISISMQEAKQRFVSETGYIILDVRHDYEYAEGHIPGAILIDNDLINADTVGSLPQKNQLIFVYCRSGRRSKEAAQKLVDLGYTNIVEIGGILDWDGELE